MPQQTLMQMADQPRFNGIPEYTPEILSAQHHPYVVYVFTFNEGARLGKFLDRFPPPDQRRYDIMIGDDGSTDGSVPSTLLRRNAVRGATRLKSNQGLSTNIKAALHWFLGQNYRAIICVNGNNRDNPEAIPLFLKALEEGCAYVQGSRFIQGGRAVHTPIVRYAAIRLIHAPLFSLVAGKRMTDTTNGYRAFSATFLRDNDVHPFNAAFSRYELEQYLAAKAIWLKYRACEVPVTRAYAPGRVSTHIRTLADWLNMLKPLFLLALRWYR